MPTNRVSFKAWLFSALLLLCAPPEAHCQASRLGLSYDTTISIGVEGSESFQRILLLGANDRGVWTFIPSPKPTDSVLLKRLDLSSLACTSFRVVVPGLRLQLAQPRYTAISADSTHLAILFVHVLLLFDLVRTPSLQVRYHSSLPLIEPFDYANLSDSILFLGRYYDYAPDATKRKGLLVALNLLTGASHSWAPSLLGIEMTHFQPSHYIDSRGSDVLSGEPVDYRVIHLNRDLLPLDSFKRTPPHWRTADTSIFSNLRRIFPPEKARALTDSLDVLKEQFSTIENVQFANKNQVLVRFVNFDARGDRKKYYDRWVRNGESRWILQDSDVTLTEPDPAIPTTRDNFPIFGYSTGKTAAYCGERYIEIRAMAPVLRLGRSTKEIKQEESEILKHRDVEYEFVVYNVLRIASK